MTLPRLVATDLDGTLVRSDGTVSSYTAGVLAELERRGVPVVFVTGRPLRWAREVFEYVGSHGLAIVSNGALVWDVAGEKVWLERTIPPNVCAEVCARLAEAVPGTRFAVERADGITMEGTYRPERDAVRAPLDELVAQPVYKLLALHESLDPDDYLKLGEEAIGSLVSVTHSSRAGLLEISGLDVTKASTLTLVSAELGISPQDAIAFGDMPNDLEMLKWAGTSVAMADSHPAVLACASRVAPGSEEDGVAQVLAEVWGL